MITFLCVAPSLMQNRNSRTGPSRLWLITLHSVIQVFFGRTEPNQMQDVGSGMHELARFWLHSGHNAAMAKTLLNQIWHGKVQHFGRAMRQSPACLSLLSLSKPAKPACLSLQSLSV